MTQYTCFIISPIGSEGSETRVQADDFLELLAIPALERYNFQVTRADRIAHASAITADIIRHVQEADICLIDMTANNPNVFYECGRRHENGKPFIQLVRKGFEDKLPFDVAGIRTITYDVSSPRSARESVLKLQGFIDALLVDGFKVRTSGESLSSIASGIERIERKIDSLVSSPMIGGVLGGIASNGVQDGEFGLDDAITDILLPPREVFMKSLRRNDLDRAFTALLACKNTESHSNYVALASVLAIAGHRRSFEIINLEMRNALDRVGEVTVDSDNSDELIQVCTETVKRYYENCGEPMQGIRALEDIYHDVISSKCSNETKAFVANKVGMAYWLLEKVEDCVKWSQTATVHHPLAAYYYNLALAFERLERAESLKSTLAILRGLPDLNEDHIRLLRRNGVVPGKT